MSGYKTNQDLDRGKNCVNLTEQLTFVMWRANPSGRRTAVNSNFFPRVKQQAPQRFLIRNQG